MTTPAAEATLTSLKNRLQSGLYGSWSQSRRFGQEEDDGARLASWIPARLPELLKAAHSVRGYPRGEPLAGIDEIAVELSAERGQRLLNAIVFSPHLVLDRMAVLCSTSRTVALDAWLGSCWVTEAAWTAVGGEVPSAPGVGPGDSALLRPVAARTRFLVLSEPMRSRGSGESPWLVDSRMLGSNGLLGNAFGRAAWPELIERCRAARREWKDCLDAYQSHPLLSHASPAQLEQEIETLMFAGSGPRPLVLSVRPLREDVDPVPEDLSVIADCTERHLLPRFALATVARTALYDRSRGRRRARRLLAAAVAVAALAAAGCAAALLPRWAAGLAAACYGLIGLGAVLLPDEAGGEWTMLWLLRMPAAAAVGAFALISFFPAAWRGGVPGGWSAAGALLLASVGYLLVEARNHGVARRTAPGRALLVALIGAVHGLLVTLIGLVFIAPAFASGGLSGLWAHPGYRNAGMVLALGTAWCLTVGVFSQILWDDRPITAPLAHLSWRGGRSE
jgi:hypothetical protein